MASNADQGLYRRYLRYGVGVLSAFALASILRETWFTALASSATGLTLAAIYWAEVHQQVRFQNGMARAFVALLMILVLIAAARHLPGVLPWAYLVPLAVFVAFPLRWALTLTMLFLLLLLWLSGNPLMGPMRHQYFPTVLLCAGLSCVFVYLREVKARQLAPLRRADTLTLASTREHLNSDLYKEIQRSEREGTDLAVVVLALTPVEHSGLPTADRRALLRQVGRILHEELRDFDGYYRTADAQFLLILPGTRTANAVRLAEKLRRDIRDLLKRQDTPMIFSAGVAGLNVGDDAQSLQDKALTALKRSQQQGGDRIQSYTDNSPPSDSDSSTGTGVSY